MSNEEHNDNVIAVLSETNKDLYDAVKPYVYFLKKKNLYKFVKLSEETLNLIICIDLFWAYREEFFSQNEGEDK